MIGQLLLMEETEVPGGNHQLTQSDLQLPPMSRARFKPKIDFHCLWLSWSNKMKRKTQIHSWLKMTRHVGTHLKVLDKSFLTDANVTKLKFLFKHMFSRVPQRKVAWARKWYWVLVPISTSHFWNFIFQLSSHLLLILAQCWLVSCGGNQFLTQSHWQPFRMPWSGFEPAWQWFKVEKFDHEVFPIRKLLYWLNS